jgi:hypothetical protein
MNGAPVARDHLGRGEARRLTAPREVRGQFTQARCIQTLFLVRPAKNASASTSSKDLLGSSRQQSFQLLAPPMISAARR